MTDESEIPDGYHPEDDSDTTDEKGVPDFVWIAAGVLVACGSAVLFIAKRRKNKKVMLDKSAKKGTI